jgi:hypothetical protein
MAAATCSHTVLAVTSRLATLGHWIRAVGRLAPELFDRIFRGGRVGNWRVAEVEVFGGLGSEGFCSGIVVEDG